MVAAVSVEAFNNSEEAFHAGTQGSGTTQLGDPITGVGNTSTG